MLLVRVIGVLALLVIIGAVWMEIVSCGFASSSPPEPLPGNFDNHVMAMEFVSRVADVEAIVGEKAHPNRDTMRKQMRIDFLWIVCYALLFIAVGLLLARRNSPWAIYLACGAGVCGVSATGFDLSENLRILEVLDAPRVTQQMVDGVRHAATVKWTLVFVTMALLAVTFFRTDRWVKLVGWMFVATAVIGFTGLVHKPYLRFIAAPMMGGLLLLVILAIGFPHKLMERLR